MSIGIHPVSVRHQEFLQDIFIHLHTFFEENNDLRAKLLLNPIALTLEDDDVVIYPDLIILFQEYYHYISPYYIVGPPNIVIEIVCPSSFKYDFGKKKDYYERIGVTELWLINAEQNECTICILHDGKYTEKINFDLDQERLDSKLLPGFSYP